MGKWTFLRGRYPKAPIDSTYQQKINAVLDSPARRGESTPTIRELASAELCEFYNLVRTEKERLEGLLKVASLTEAAVTQLFVDRFEEQSITKQTFDNGTTISISDEPYPFVKDQSALLGWVKANNLEDMLTLNFMTMSSLVKERLSGQKSEPLPDGVDIFMKTKLSRRSKAGATTEETTE